jgi:hypothetical protein
VSDAERAETSGDRLHALAVLAPGQLDVVTRGAESDVAGKLLGRVLEGLAQRPVDDAESRAASLERRG